MTGAKIKFILFEFLTWRFPSIMLTNHIRQSFIDYFIQQGHQHFPSSPLLPQNDPTLMFANAGMNQFKGIITGKETPKSTRAVSSQKCVRAGGKHNDLDNVGYTARHHTFFEMLGNFSFGDYFKEDAIRFAWEFLTSKLEIPKDKLLITIYHTDDDAYKLWVKQGVPESRIIRIDTNDNFWAMGDTGPCGPCSEIFYDHGSSIPGGPPGSAEADGDRFVEIWNLVFMQFDRQADGEMLSLPKPCIDTGMGLERISSILHKVHNNFEIDIFKSIISDCKDVIKQKSTQENIASYRVIADHLRAIGFLISDGILPSNEGRGFVLRRIMRRAMRHAHQLGGKLPVIYQLVPSLISSMGQAYPELGRTEALITETLKLEEERFGETLGRGLKLLNTETDQLKAGDVLNGEVAFKLYDTFGFPLDLTTDILRNRDIAVDNKGFEQAMEKQRELARKAWVGSGDAAAEEVWFDLLNRFGATEFTGYSYEAGQGEVIALLANKKEVTNISADSGASKSEQLAIITNQTPFYGESGGQMGDHGLITGPDGKFIVTDTKKYLGKLHVHYGYLEDGIISTGDTVELIIDSKRRKQLRNNHSATHLLQTALRKQLGGHVMQKGSSVEAERFRFDFSHPHPLTKEQISIIEQQVNEAIIANHKTHIRYMPLDQAIERGALAMFGEKYEDEVRVVSLGQIDEEAAYSIELCGGTHVNATGDIGCFKIISDAAIAAGVRRIEATTGIHALNYLGEFEQLVAELKNKFNCATSDISARVDSLIQTNKELSQQVTNLKLSAVQITQADKEDCNGKLLVIKQVSDVPAKDLRMLASRLWKEEYSYLLLLSVVDKKVAVLCQASSEAASKVSAVTLAQLVAESLGAKGGGGSPQLAQAGGVNISAIPEAIKKVKESLA